MLKPNFSYHIFLLPFNWGKNVPQNHGSHFSQLVDMKDAEKLVINDQRWKVNAYQRFSEPEDYNEYVYFYPTVRDVLYDNNTGVDENKVIRHYQFDPARNNQLKYAIHVEAGKINKIYELEIDHILLNLYRSGIGLLSFHLKNSKADQQQWDDILAINDFGRRIYPPFFNYADKVNFSVRSTKAYALASKISIAGSPGVAFEEIIEDFETITGLSTNYAGVAPEKLCQIPNHIKKVLPERFCEQFNVRPTLDDRMFVVSSVCDNESKYSTKVINLGKSKTNADFSAEFYKFIFIDGPGDPGVANDEMQWDLLQNHLYKRWSGYGTLYGLSRYSLVSYSSWDKILVDTRTIYYKIAELCLLQRSSVIKFSEEIRRIAAMNENETRYSDYINDLYRNYIIFINKIYFRDVTPQEQGIELYDMLRSKMRIEKEVTDLDNEINELHNYALLQEERSGNTRLQVLTILGGLFIVPSFISGYYGAHENIIQNPARSHALVFVLFIMAFVSLAVSLLAVQQGSKSSRKKFVMGISRKTLFIFIIVVIAIMCILLFFPVK